jgi:hypothetical protein
MLWKRMDRTESHTEEISGKDAFGKHRERGKETKKVGLDEKRRRDCIVV